MATLSRRRRTVAAVLVALAIAAVAAASCGKLVGLGGPVTPLATIRVEVPGEVAPFIPDSGAGLTPNLRVTLVWGQEWLPEPLCLLPADSDAGAEVKAAGCPDILGFVPARVAADAPLAADGTATLELINLPSADVMVGDVTARVAYGSIYLYDDRNGNGTLDLRAPPDRGEGRDQSPVADAGTDPDVDVVYGASLISMTLPDQRIAFREGAFNATIAFYPRAGCPDPPPLFSILSAGGFSLEEALVAAALGQLPQEDPATCGEATLDEGVFSVPPQAPEPIKQLRCLPADSAGFTSYRGPPDHAPDLQNLTWACVPLPRLPGDDGGVEDGGVDVSGMEQLVIASPPGMECRNVWHYIPRGCRDDPACATPTWTTDWTSPDGGVAAWWPCARWP
jgi:hypothetical protein